MENNRTVRQIVMPQFAESVVSATITRWLKAPGDPVEEYEPLCEVMTDKVTAELPSTFDGVVAEILVPEGRTVPVGTAVCTVYAAESAVREAAGASPTGAAAANVPGMANASGAASASGGGRPSGPGSLGRPAPEGRSRLSPAVRRLAEQHALDLGRIRGTGLGGRITRKDVLAYLASEGTAGRSDGADGGAVGAAERSAAPSGVTVWPAAHAGSAASVQAAPRAAAPQAPFLHPAATAPAGDVDVERGETIIDVTPIRHTIATRMRQSVSEIPHAWTMIEVDVTNLVALRNKLKDEFQRREGINLTYLAFVLKAVVNAIKDYPIINSVWAVDKIIIKRDINISLAVGTEEAVYVPVIKNADQKNIAGLAREIHELTRKAREGRLTYEDMQGGTITVNNTGSFGSILSQPIINYPQAVNLTFEAIVKRPVVIGDMIAVRSMANMCLSLDHRILDGVVCGRFLQRVKENIESYGMDTKLY
jgi:2-oxoisovalerate dehydrogenase E2 component (dihydrolipoyl transacylase)